MIMNIMMFAMLYPVMLILFIVFRNTGKSNDKMTYGVHLSQELVKSEAVAGVTAKYKKESNLVMIVFAVIPFAFLAAKHVSVQFTLWMMWFLVAMVAAVVPYVRANKAVMALKKDSIEKEAATVADDKSDEAKVVADNTSNGVQYVETNIVRTVKLIDFLPQMIISVLAPICVVLAGKFIYPDIKDFSMLEVYIWITVVIAAITVLSYATAKLMDNSRAVVISAESGVNTAFNRAKKSIWKKVWLWEAWLNTLVVVAIAVGAVIQKNSFIIFIVAMIIETVVGIAVVVVAAADLNKVEVLYEEKRNKVFDPDNDEYWVWGMFYNNPNDKRKMVEKRYGAGMTTNMATKAGKASMWVAVLALIWIPFICVWLIMEDYTPMHVYSQDNQIVCYHLTESYKVPFENITEAEMLTNLPESRSKISGSGTESYEKGKYSCRDYGTYYTFVRCENELFIRITTDEKIYIISGFDDVETQNIYDEIIAKR